MIVGMTGTKYGMVETQFWAFHQMLKELGATELHHGDCVGADAQAHEIGRDLGLWIVVHPPKNPKYRAWCQGDLILPEDEYLVRNEHIVNASECLIGTPRRFYEERRSGTWHCLRYAKRIESPYVIILPNGQELLDF